MTFWPELERTRDVRDAPQPFDFEDWKNEIHPRMPQLRAVARRILGDDDAADDAVQEALIALWRSGAPATPLRLWLIRAVVHRSLHARRTQQRREFWEAHAARALPQCTLCNPERSAEATEFWECLERIVAELSADHRDVWLLRELGGLDYQEISDHLLLPLGTVRSRLNRARARVRECLRTQGASSSRDR